MTKRIFLKLLIPVFVAAAVPVLALGWLLPASRSLPARWWVALTLALVMASGVALILARKLAGWLGAVETFARAIGAGKLSARFANPSEDQFSPARSSLEGAALQLEKSFRELETGRQQLETLLNSMEDAVVAVSPLCDVVWFNQAMTRLAGGSIEIGRPLVRGLRDPDLLRVVGQVLKGRQVGSSTLFTVVPGHAFVVTSAPLPDGGAVCVLRDTTELARVERTRRDFIANVSHELGTPLTSLLGYTETLLDESSDPKTRSFLEIVRRNALRMSRLTEDLLTLARVESGEDRLELGPIPARELVREAQISLREVARSRGVEIEIGEAPDRFVSADRDAIHQVFANLIDNALKYATEAKKIEIGAVERASELEFYVRDFGPGIPSEHLPRLFERFYRVDKARSREAGGTGLGLAIAKHIVLNHGGQIGVTSELGQGSVFWFRLPRVENKLGTTVELAEER